MGVESISLWFGFGYQIDFFGINDQRLEAVETRVLCQTTRELFGRACLRPEEHNYTLPRCFHLLNKTLLPALSLLRLIIVNASFKQNNFVLHHQ